SLVDRIAGGKVFVDVADIHDDEVLIKRTMAETAFGDAANQHHLAAFFELTRQAGTGTGVLALAAARRGLAHPAADAPADSLLWLAPVNTAMYGAQVHYSFTPRSRSTSPRVQLLQAANGRLDEVDRVGGTVHLGEDIVNAAGLQHLAHSWPGLHACARSGR